MSMPASIANTLDRDGITYRLHGHRPARSLEEAARECEIPAAHMVRGVLLEDALGVVLAVLPLTHSIDFQALKQLTGRALQPARAESVARIFFDCEPGSIPPFARPYQINALFEQSLAELPQICFEPGDHRILVCMESSDFVRLHGKSQHAAFSQPLQSLSARDSTFFSDHNAQQLQQLRPLGNIADRVSNLKHLPAMPGMAAQLLRLRNRRDTTADELCVILGQDPSLAAQLLRHARSAWFGYQGRVETLEEAVTAVLGVDAALNMALGVAVSQRFHIVSEGPLGINAFWRHAVFSAALAEALARLVPAHLGVRPGTAYLAGLLHNIGFLVMGQLLQPEFYLLNKVVEANPAVPITLVEKRLLGVGHTHIGAWLMRSWQMPEEIVTAVREHHNEVHRGDHSHYVHLMIVVDCLLKGYGVGDGPSRSVPPHSLNQLGLDLRRASEITEQLIEQAEGLHGLASQLCA